MFGAVLLQIFMSILARTEKLCYMLASGGSRSGILSAEALGLAVTWHITFTGTVVVLEFHNPTFEKTEQGG